MQLEFLKSFNADAEQVPLITKYLRANVGRFIADETKLEDVTLAMDEAVTNIIMHAYADVGDEVERVIEVCVNIEDSRLTIELCDFGKEFDLQAVPAPDVAKNMAGDRNGGFGIFLIKKLMDEFIYRRKNDRNLLTLVANL